MSDIVQRLRDSATQARALDRAALLNEAADEIERLRLMPEERIAIERAAWNGVRQRVVCRTLRAILERLK